jgi:acetylornithine deacetylase/succinyl-diaminopimelate desuccinylase-like protein
MADVNLTEVFEAIGDREQEYLERLIDYVRRPSISAHGEGIGEVAEYIAGVLDVIGLETRIIPTAGWPMVFAEHCQKPGAPTVLL